MYKELSKYILRSQPHHLPHWHKLRCRKCKHMHRKTKRGEPYFVCAWKETLHVGRGVNRTIYRRIHSPVGQKRNDSGLLRCAYTSFATAACAWAEEEKTLASVGERSGSMSSKRSANEWQPRASIWKTRAGGESDKEGNEEEKSIARESKQWTITECGKKGTSFRTNLTKLSFQNFHFFFTRESDIKSRSNGIDELNASRLSFLDQHRQLI